MAFVIHCSINGSVRLPDAVAVCLQHHSSARQVPQLVEGEGVAVAAVEPARVARFADGVTIVVAGRPRLQGPQARSLADAEVIHALYSRDDDQLVSSLWGTFAIAIADPAKRCCLLLRDRIGFVPLFYGVCPGGLWVSDSTKPLLASRFTSFSLDVDAIYRYLYLKAFESPNTVVREIHSLPPGSLLRFDDGRVAVERYWDLPLPVVPAPDAGVRTEERLEELLTASLADTAAPDGRGNAILLSGGVDSGVLTALHGSAGSGFAVNVGFEAEWREMDESGDAQRVADACGIPLRRVLFDFPSLLRSLPVLLWNNNLPTANSGFKLNLIGVSLDRDESIGTYLLGEGADTVLGYGWKWQYFHALHRLAPLGAFLPPAVRGEVLALLERGLSRLQDSPLGNRYTGIVASYAASLLGYWKWKGSRFRPDEVASLFSMELRPALGHRLISHVFRTYYDTVSGGSLAEKFIYASLKSYTPNQQLMNYQTACNYFGAELACPYLDERVVELCLRLPVTAREGKRVLKSLAERLIPAEVVNRPKRVFLMPMEAWVAGPLWPLVDLVFSRPVVERRRLFDPLAMTGLRDRFRQGRFTSWSDIWSFVVLEAWLRINYDAAVPRCPTNLGEVFPEIGSLPVVGSV